MDREEQAKQAQRLRRAMAVAGLNHDDVATALGVSKRTVTNWRDANGGTMPTTEKQIALARLLPNYSDEGDRVEDAITHTPLAPFRQAELVAVYKRLLHEQAREDQATGS